MKTYHQMTPEERTTYIAEQRAEIARSRQKLRTDMAEQLRAEGVPENEIAARVEAYFNQPFDDGFDTLAAESDERSRHDHFARGTNLC